MSSNASNTSVTGSTTVNSTTLQTHTVPHNASGRDWSGHNESTRSESVQFTRDCYSLIYRLVLDSLHYYNQLFTAGASIGTGDSKEKTLKDNHGNEKIDFDLVKSILGIFKKLLDDAASIFRSKWQNRSIKNVLLQLVCHTNHFAIRTRGLQLLLTYLDIFSLTNHTQPSSSTEQGTSSSIIVSDLAVVLRDVVDLRPFCLETPSLLTAKPVVEWFEYLNHGMVTSGRNLIFPFMEDTRMLLSQESFNCNMHLFDAILNYVLRQPVQYTPPDGLSPSATNAAIARAQCVHFKYWFGILKEGLFTYLYPTVAEKIGLSNVNPPAPASNVSSPTAANSAASPPTASDSISPTAASPPTTPPLTTPRCVGFRPMCPLSLHVVVITWLLKSFQLPNGLSSSAGTPSSNTILNELCNDSSNLALIMEIFRQSFILLPVKYAHIISDILDIYSHWIRGEYLTPTIFHSMQTMMKSMMDHVFPAFCLFSNPPEIDDLEDESNGVSSIEASHSYRMQLKLCGSVIQFYTLISHEPFVILNENSWEHLLVTLLNATNYLVKMGQFEPGTNQHQPSQPSSSYGATAPSPTPDRQVNGVYSTMDHLINPLLSCLFDCYLRSCVSLTTTSSSFSLTTPITLTPSSSENNSGLMMQYEMESKIRSWLHGSQSSTGSSKAVIDSWKRKLLELTRSLLTVLANVTSADDALTRPRSQHEPSAAASRSSLNPIVHNHRIGSVAAFNTHQTHGAPSQLLMQQQFATGTNPTMPAPLTTPTPLFSTPRRHQGSASLSTDFDTSRPISLITEEEIDSLQPRDSISRKSSAESDGRWGVPGTVGHTGALSFMGLPTNPNSSSTTDSASATYNSNAPRPLETVVDSPSSNSTSSLPLDAPILNSDPSVLRGFVDFNESFRTWLHFLRLIGHPHFITDASSRHLAWKGIIDSLLFFIHTISRPVTSKKAQLTGDAKTVIGPFELDPSIELSRKFLPQGTTLLHIFGPLLFEACYCETPTELAPPLFPSGSPLMNGHNSSAPSLNSSPLVSGSASPMIVPRIRSAYTPVVGVDNSGIRAMALAAVAITVSTRTATPIQPEFLTAFIFHLRCGLSSSASHMEWTLLKQCQRLFVMDHLVPSLYVVLPEFLRVVATWSTPLSVFLKERETVSSGRKKKKERDGVSSVNSSPRRRRSHAPNQSGVPPTRTKRREPPPEIRAACMNLLFSWLCLPYAYGTRPLVALPPLPAAHSIAPPLDLGSGLSSTSIASTTKQSTSFSLKQSPNYSNAPSHALLQSIPGPNLSHKSDANEDSFGSNVMDSPRRTSSMMLSSILNRERSDGGTEHDLFGSLPDDNGTASLNPLSSSGILSKSPGLDEADLAGLPDPTSSLSKHRITRSNPGELVEFSKDVDSSPSPSPDVSSGPLTTILSKSTSLDSLSILLPSSSVPSSTTASPRISPRSLTGGGPFSSGLLGSYTDFASLKGDILYILKRTLAYDNLSDQVLIRVRSIWAMYIIVIEEIQMIQTPTINSSNNGVDCISQLSFQALNLIRPPILPPPTASSIHHSPTSIVTAELATYLNALQLQGHTALEFFMALSYLGDVLKSMKWSGLTDLQDLRTKLLEVNPACNMWTSNDPPHGIEVKAEVDSEVSNGSTSTSTETGSTGSVSETIIECLCMVGEEMLRNFQEIVTPILVQKAQPVVATPAVVLPPNVPTAAAARLGLSSGMGLMSPPRAIRPQSQSVSVASTTVAASARPPRPQSLFTVPPFMATPLRKEYFELYSKLLPQLLYCLLEWFMNSPSMQSILFMSSSSPSVFLVGSRVKNRLFTFLDSCLSCLEQTKQKLREVHIRAQQTTTTESGAYSPQRSPPTTAETNGDTLDFKVDVPALPASYVTACSTISDTAFIVLKHILNRVHHFPVRSASPTSDVSDVTGLTTSTITEENDHVCDPAPEALIQVQMRVETNETQVLIVPASPASEPEDVPRVHFVYDESVLITAFERVQFNDPLHTIAPTTTIRLIVRDLTGKYVYDFNLVEDGLSCWNFHAIRQQLLDTGEVAPNPSSAIRAIHPRLLIETAQKHQERQFKQLEAEWSAEQVAIANVVNGVPFTRRRSGRVTDVQPPTNGTFKSLVNESTTEGVEDTSDLIDTLEQLDDDEVDQDLDDDVDEAMAIEGVISPIHGMASPTEPTFDGDVSVGLPALPAFQVNAYQDPLEQVMQYIQTNFHESELLSTTTHLLEQQRTMKDQRISTIPNNDAVSASSAPVAASHSPNTTTTSSTSAAAPSSPSGVDGEAISVMIDMSGVRIDENAFSGGVSPDDAKKKVAISDKAKKLMGIQIEETSTTLIPATNDSPLASRSYLSPFDFCRALLMRIYVNLDHLPSALSTSAVSSPHPSLVLLEDSIKLRRSLKLLDTNPCRECHKIGVIFVGPQQDSQKSILSNECGSPLYESFLEELGQLVSLDDHLGFSGGLDSRSTGTHSRYWSSSTMELMYHIVTMMPSKSLEVDDQQIHKKKQVGNDHVHIVWSEFYRDYRPSTISSQFNHVHIIIYPMMIPTSDGAMSMPLSLHHGLYRISIHCKPSVPSFGPLQDGMVIRGCHLGTLVRLTALNANRAIRYATAGYGKPEPTRRKYIDEMIQKSLPTNPQQPIDSFRSLIVPLLSHNSSAAATTSSLISPHPLPSTSTAFPSLKAVPAPRLVGIEPNPGPCEIHLTYTPMCADCRAIDDEFEEGKGCEVEAALLAQQELANFPSDGPHTGPQKERPGKKCVASNCPNECHPPPPSPAPSDWRDYYCSQECATHEPVCANYRAIDVNLSNLRSMSLMYVSKRARFILFCLRCGRRMMLPGPCSCDDEVSSSSSSSVLTSHTSSTKPVTTSSPRIFGDIALVYYTFKVLLFSIQGLFAREPLYSRLDVSPPDLAAYSPFVQAFFTLHIQPLIGVQKLATEVLEHRKKILYESLKLPCPTVNSSPYVMPPTNVVWLCGDCHTAYPIGIWLRCTTCAIDLCETCFLMSSHLTDQQRHVVELIGIPVLASNAIPSKSQLITPSNSIVDHSPIDVNVLRPPVTPRLECLRAVLTGLVNQSLAYQPRSIVELGPSLMDCLTSVTNAYRYLRIDHSIDVPFPTELPGIGSMAFELVQRHEWKVIHCTNVSQMQVGDLAFWHHGNFKKPATHVSMVLDPALNQHFHCSLANKGAKIEPLNEFIQSPTLRKLKKVNRTGTCCLRFIRWSLSLLPVVLVSIIWFLLFLISSTPTKLLLWQRTDLSTTPYQACTKDQLNMDSRSGSTFTKKECPSPGYYLVWEFLSRWGLKLPKSLRWNAIIPVKDFEKNDLLTRMHRHHAMKLPRLQWCACMLAVNGVYQKDYRILRNLPIHTLQAQYTSATEQLKLMQIRSWWAY